MEHSKPCPDIYLMACGELGAKPGEAYAIEDSPNGIRSAYRAGMRPLMVPDMIAPDGEMRELSEKYSGIWARCWTFSGRKAEKRKKRDRARRKGEARPGASRTWEGESGRWQHWEYPAIQ